MVPMGNTDSSFLRHFKINPGLCTINSAMYSPSSNLSFRDIYSKHIVKIIKKIYVICFLLS